MALGDPDAACFDQQEMFKVNALLLVIFAIAVAGLWHNDHGKCSRTTTSV
jgi:hypothetical protein